MKTGVYKTAQLALKHIDGSVEYCDLQEASLTVYPAGIAEIVYYLEGDKTPSNKQTICIPMTCLMLFRASGYAF